MPTERPLYQDKIPYLIAVLLGIAATCAILDLIWSSSPATPHVCPVAAGPYVVQVAPSMVRTQVLAYDSRTGQAWLYNSEQGTWTRMPELPGREGRE